MQVVYSEDGLLHNPVKEITGGVIKDYVESPKRLLSIKRFIDSHREFEIVSPNDYSLGPILDVHSQDYVQFLQDIYNEWVAEGNPPDFCMGDTFNQVSMMGKIDPEIIRRNGNQRAGAKFGYYTCDMSISFVKDSWRAAYASAQVAISAGHRLLETLANNKENNSSVYALCRPPGHHSAHKMAAGYCFINNAAVVTRFLQNYTLEDMNRAKKPFGVVDLQAIRNKEFSHGTAIDKKKILIVDIDYHHGNGTQDIFYDDNTVFYISLHGSPDYPFFTGSKEEKGCGKGLGYNINIPLDPKTTTDEMYLDELKHVLHEQSVTEFNADIVVVSMGLDTWHEDPIAGMKQLKEIETYTKMGSLIKTSLGTRYRPVLFVQEGGYTIDKLGDLAGKILAGYLQTNVK